MPSVVGPVVIPILLARDRRAIGGTAAYVIALEAQLRRAGIGVTLIGCGPTRARERDFVSLVTHPHPQGRHLSWALWRARRDWEFSPETLIHLQRPDHVLGFEQGPWPLVITFHGRHQRTVALRGGPLAGALYRRLERRAGERADALVFVAQADREALLAEHPEWAGKAHHVPVGIARDLFTPGDRDAARRALGLPARALAVVYVGRLEPEKNVPALIAATAALPGVELWIAGRGRAEADCRRAAGDRWREGAHSPAQAAPAPSPDRVAPAGVVRFLGHLERERLPHLLRAADALALASRHEGLPTVVLEAWACGRPVVAPPVGDLPALLAAGGGRLAPDNHPATLAAALRALLAERPTDPQARATEERALRARTERYAWERIALETRDVYEQALRRRAAGGGGFPPPGRPAVGRIAPGEPRAPAPTRKAEPTPEVSVVLPVYNSAAFLAASIESVLAQTYTDFELIAIDDGSTDESPRILERYAHQDRRVRLLTHARNRGLIAALNSGLEAARGRYLARMDADDICLPERLALQVAFLERHPEIFLVGGAAIQIDARGRRLGRMRTVAAPRRIAELLAERNCIFHPTILFRRRAGLHYREKMRYVEDYDFYLRLLSDGEQLANLKQPLLLYRLHAGSLSLAHRARQVLFGEQARRFYETRLTTGTDAYDAFDPEEILTLDLEQTRDERVLRAQAISAFALNDGPETRRWIRRYWRIHGRRRVPRFLLYVPASYLPGGLLRPLKRAVKALLHGARWGRS